jgi:hypothetical protein
MTAPAPLGPNGINNHIAKRAPSRHDNAGGAWVALTGALTIGNAVTASPSAVILRFQAGTSFSGAAGAIGYLHLGSSSSIVLQAEL